jgi:hypothetical protein
MFIKKERLLNNKYYKNTVMKIMTKMDIQIILMIPTAVTMV